MLDQIRAQTEGLALWWTGQNGWLIKSDGLLISTDLVTDDPTRAAPSPILAEQIAPELDVAFITHAHGDHFNAPTCKVLAAQGRCLFVLPRSCLAEAEKMGLPRDRIVIVQPRRSTEIRGIKVEPQRALHGNEKGAVYYDANLDDVGYVFHLNGRTVYQIGDSVLLEDQLFLKHVDVLLFSPTEHNTHIHDSVTLINELEPDVILPQHHGTYPATERWRFWATGYPHEVKWRLPKHLRERYHVLPMGGRIVVG